MASVSALLLVTFLGVNLSHIIVLFTRYQGGYFRVDNILALKKSTSRGQRVIDSSIYAISLIYFLIYFSIFKFSLGTTSIILSPFLFSVLFLFILSIGFRWRYMRALKTAQFTCTSFIYFFLQLIIICSLFISNLISFLLLLEVVSACYYFFFLLTTSSYHKHILAFKNLFILYLFISYLTVVGFIIGLSLLSYSYGTCMFQELRLFTYENTAGYWVILGALGLKLGVPYFHFFKLELYQALSLESLVIFSIFSLYFNLFIYYVLCILYLPFFSPSLLIIIMLSSFGLLLSMRQSIYFAQFIALSGIITSVTLLLFMYLT